MPTWIAYILAAAGLVTAIGILWAKVLRPVGKFIVDFVVAEREMLPLLKELTSVFRDTPNAFAVLDEIVRQFRTDSGSSLRDVVNRLETLAQKGQIDADLLKVGVEASRLLAQLDREKLDRFILLLDRLSAKVEAGAATGLRNEDRAIGVAKDLAASQKSAAEINSTEAGAAADAAALPLK